MTIPSKLAGANHVFFNASRARLKGKEHRRHILDSGQEAAFEGYRGQRCSSIDYERTPAFVLQTAQKYTGGFRRNESHRVLQILLQQKTFLFRVEVFRYSVYLILLADFSPPVIYYFLSSFYARNNQHNPQNIELSGFKLYAMVLRFPL